MTTTTDTRLRWIGRPTAIDMSDDWNAVSLERFDDDEQDWVAFGGDDVDGCEPAEDTEPYVAAEDRLLARHGLTRDEVAIVTPW